MDQSAWNFEFIKLHLKVTWKISRNSSTHKNNLLVSFKETIDGKEYLFQGEAAPNVRYGESPEKLENECTKFKKLIDKANNLEDLLTLLVSTEFSNCFIFAITTIFHQRQAKRQNKAFFEYLKLPQVHQCTTSFSVPMLALDEIENYVSDNKLANSPLLKLKVRNEQDIEQYKKLREFFRGKLIIDANEGMQSIEQWQLFNKSIDDFSNIVLIEQPFPADQVELYQKVMPDSPIPIFLDESILNQEITPELKSQCHGINVKLMKSGDILLAKSQLEKAKALGLRTMLGCMIESSLAISQAFHLAPLAEFIDLDGFALLKDDPLKKMSYQNQILRLDI